MREERRCNLGQLSSSSLSLSSSNDNDSDENNSILLAKKHYFALRKIKDGKPAHAESIYRRILDELLAQDDCDHAQLAVTTLLLALLLQGRQHRQQQHGDPKQVRAVFLNFFRIVSNHNNNNNHNNRPEQQQQPHQQCACSAKVLQAFALFEMKQGNPLKSLYLVRRALQLDPTLQPVLQWKQFRDAVRRDAAPRLRRRHERKKGKKKSPDVCFLEMAFSNKVECNTKSDSTVSAVVVSWISLLYISSILDTTNS